MQQKKELLCHTVLCLGPNQLTHAANTDNVSKQIQLQQIQDNQQKQIIKLNTQVQLQLKNMQTDLQAQIQKDNNTSQNQLKMGLNQLRAQINQGPRNSVVVPRL